MSCVLACIDFSDISTRVLEVGCGLSRALGVELVVLHVAAAEPEFVGYSPGPQSVRDQVAQGIRASHRDLDARVAALVAGGFTARPLMVQGSPAASILDHAGRLGAELVVLGSHGHGMLHQLLVGSVAEAVLRRARVPVVAVPALSRS